MNASSARFEFTPAEWGDVASVIGNLGDVEYIDLGDDGFEFVGFFDPDLLDEFRADIKPASLDHVKSHIESHIAQARAAAFAPFVVRAIGERELKVATAAKQLLDLLIPIDPSDSGLLRTPMYSRRFRSDLAALAESAQSTSTEIAGWLRKPAARPPVPEFRITYWGYLMRLWTDVLNRPPTNSPGGQLARFIDSASAPARDILEPSQGKAFQFVKEYRHTVWAKSTKRGI